MKNWTKLLILLTLGSCLPTTDKDLISGELYFGSPVRQLARPGIYSDELTESINKTDFDDTAAVLDLVAKTQANIKRITRDHFIDLLVDKDSVIRLQLDSSDFARVSEFKYDQLCLSKKKVNLKANVQKIEHGFYKCTNLVDVIVVDGRTRGDKELEQQQKEI